MGSGLLIDPVAEKHNFFMLVPFLEGFNVGFSVVIAVECMTVCRNSSLSLGLDQDLSSLVFGLNH